MDALNRNYKQKEMEWKHSHTLIFLRRIRGAIFFFQEVVHSHYESKPTKTFKGTIYGGNWLILANSTAT